MAREFIINIDSSCKTGTLNSTIVQRPFIQHTNSIAALKNINKVYNMYVEKQDMGTNNT